MQSSLKLALATGATCVLGLALTVPTLAGSPARNVNSDSYNIYQSPGGGYDSVADYSRDLEGTPCGMNCTRAAQLRWAHHTNTPYSFGRPYPIPY